MIQEQQILEQVAGNQALFALGEQGFSIHCIYERSCFEWVITVDCGTDQDGRPVVVEQRDKNPETAWRRVKIELQDRRLWPL